MVSLAGSYCAKSPLICEDSTIFILVSRFKAESACATIFITRLVADASLPNGTLPMYSRTPRKFPSITILMTLAGKVLADPLVRSISSRFLRSRSCCASDSRRTFSWRSMMFCFSRFSPSDNRLLSLLSWVASFAKATVCCAPANVGTVLDFFVSPNVSKKMFFCSWVSLGQLGNSTPNILL